MSRDRDLSTRCVHDGEIPDPQGSPFTPLHNATTFRFDSTQRLLDVVEGRQAGNLYTRYGQNPTITSAEAKLASIECAESALLFTAGMAAASSLFLTYGRHGIVCIGEAYGGTLELLTEQLPALGCRTELLLGAETDRLPALLAQGMRLVFLESPTNPVLEIADIGAIATLVHAHGGLLAVDNTFATPVNQNPLALGADIVMHSATKYLGGHSDLTAGVLAGSQALLTPIRNWRKNLGQVPAPATAALLARSLRTLPLRIERQNATALAVAQALQQHPKVRRVLYPGLADFPGHALARRQMRGFGGMLTLELATDAAGAARVVDALQLILNAPSLSGAETLATLPLATSHHGMTAAERRRRGITDGMIRLSMGLEAPEDLIADLRQALERI